MEPLTDKKSNNIFEVRFKNGRKNYFKNSKDLSVSISDLVVVGAERGYDVGFVTLKGGLIPIQLKRKKINLETTEFYNIQRIASQSDIDKWTRAREKEETIKKKGKGIGYFFEFENENFRC
jgi:cell fate regulator YaaT (PSP1 superfamily)